jgi:hypothetical protein
MKKIALISTFCDTDEKIQVLINNTKILKSLGVDVMVNSPIPFDTTISSHFDFYFQTKENPILSWPERIMAHWKTYPGPNGKETRMVRGLKDYGWAALYQMKKLSEIASTFDYDIFYHVTYDLDIDSNIIEEIVSNRFNIIYPVKTEHGTWPASPLFCSFDKNNLKNIANDIEYQKYIDSSHGMIPEDWIFNWIEKFNLTHSSYHVKDKISLSKYENEYSTKFKDIFDFSEDDNYSLFFTKDKSVEIEISVMFYQINKNSKISLIVNGEIISEDPKDLEVIKTNITHNTLQKIEVISDGVLKDYTKLYFDCVFNEIYQY